MCQNWNTAILCVRKTAIDSSIQAQWFGVFMSQNWRSYGIFNNYPGEEALLKELAHQDNCHKRTSLT
jgi:hypothetical protein